VPRYGRIDSDYGMRLRSTATEADGPIYMLNLTRYRPGSVFDVTGDYEALSQDVNARYAISVLASVGATLCFVADVLASSGDWGQVAVVRYPTRRSFLAMAAQSDFQAWHGRKGEDMERTAVMGVLPVSTVPAKASPRRVLLEIWDGLDPPLVADGPVTRFEVEGTIVGDGRRWTGARHSAIEPGTPLPLLPPRPDYQALLLDPRVERW
jgi:hypothetical protein